MKREMELIRQLMLELEKQPSRGGFVLTGDDPRFVVPGFSVEQSDDHFDQIQQVQFINVVNTRFSSGWGFMGITPRDHDFLDSVRDPKIWRETKEGAEKAGGFSIDLLVALAKGLLKKKVEDHTGVKLDF